MKEIHQILDFIIETEKLKSVLRQTKPVGLQRRENSAEHSWHVCLTALMLKQYSNQTVDINRVIKMLIIHDLGEIDAGDKIIYASETEQQKMDEQNGLCRLLDMLPDNMGDEYLSLWQEFEAGTTNDSKFAKAIDRVPPLLHNIYGNGHGWNKNSISKQTVFALNSERISSGSVELWEVMEEKLNKAVEAGILK